MKRFSATIHKPVDPQEAYNNLPLSTRTTFNAVTHALISTQLTGESGQKLGSAIQIVEKLHTVRGEVLGARGDEQFRIYVQLKPSALESVGPEPGVSADGGQHRLPQGLSDLLSQQTVGPLDPGICHAG